MSSILEDWFIMSSSLKDWFITSSSLEDWFIMISSPEGWFITSSSLEDRVWILHSTNQSCVQTSPQEVAPQRLGSAPQQRVCWQVSQQTNYLAKRNIPFPWRPDAPLILLPVISSCNFENNERSQIRKQWNSSLSVNFQWSWRYSSQHNGIQGLLQIVRTRSAFAIGRNYVRSACDHKGAPLWRRVYQLVGKSTRSNKTDSVLKVYEESQISK